MTRLLVSVRDADEACAALAGGADLIDIKEPSRGALGAADPQVWREVLAAVNGRAPVSAALGELAELDVASITSATAGLLLVKAGLANCGADNRWFTSLRTLQQALSPTTALVAVAYADAARCGAPDPQQVLQAARDLRLPILLIDTYDKHHGDLWTAMPASELAELIQSAQQDDIRVALAGSLTIETLPPALALAPAWIAVRGAACDAGREGRVSTSRVHQLKALLSGPY